MTFGGSTDVMKNIALIRVLILYALHRLTDFMMYKIIAVHSVIQHLFFNNSFVNIFQHKNCNNNLKSHSLIAIFLETNLKMDAFN
jgi:hypothetical protein